MKLFIVLWNQTKQKIVSLVNLELNKYIVADLEKLYNFLKYIKLNYNKNNNSKINVKCKRPNFQFCESLIKGYMVIRLTYS